MSPFDTLESRYERDPAFHSLVTMLEATLHQLQFTPSELREAVMYAAFRFESRNPRAVMIRFEKDENELRQLREIIAAERRAPKEGT